MPQDTARRLPGGLLGSAVRGGTPRYAAADIEIGGVTIGAGDLVLLGRPTANQDAGVFSHPDRLDITREPNPHLAFGHGPYYCLGAPLCCIADWPSSRSPGEDPPVRVHRPQCAARSSLRE